MKIRERHLSDGWYPNSRLEIGRLVKRWTDGFSGRKNGIAAVVPHAGWAFSGKLAALSMASMSRELDGIVVAGGHLAPGDVFRMAEEDLFSIPGGSLRNHKVLKDFLCRQLDWQKEIDGDNTVEIQMPLVNCFWKDTKVLWIRVPPDSQAAELAALLKKWEKETGENLGVIGSTDLTHYGPSYGYMPHGRGREARDWACHENDAGIIRAMTAGDMDLMLEMALKKRAACSAGGAAAAMEFAKLSGRKTGELIGYASSYDIHPSDSFVGYAGIVF